MVMSCESTRDLPPSPSQLGYNPYMEAQTLSYLETNPAGPVRASVIWMHGLGADGHDFAGLVPLLELPPECGIRFVFPHAPYRPVSVNAGMRMRAWYDIASTDLLAHVDEAGIRASCRAVQKLLEQEIARGILPQRLVLAGFSQGGVIALETGLRFSERLAGLLALSTYLPLGKHISKEAHHANQAISIFYGHGSQDPVVPIQYARRARTQLEALGYPVNWHEYPIAHTVVLEEVHDIRDWLLNVLT